jgi:hypothetical protein
MLRTDAPLMQHEPSLLRNDGALSALIVELEACVSIVPRSGIRTINALTLYNYMLSRR